MIACQSSSLQTINSWPLILSQWVWKKTLTFRFRSPHSSSDPPAPVASRPMNLSPGRASTKAWTVASLTPLQPDTSRDTSCGRIPGRSSSCCTKRSLSITSLSLEMSRCLSDCSLESTKIKLEVGISNFWSPCAVSDVSRGWQFNRGVRSVMFVPETSKLSSMGMAQISSRPLSSRSVQARESFFKPRSMLKEACSDASPYRRKPSISSVWRPCLQSLLDVRLWRTSEIVRSLCICEAFSSWSLWGQSESLKASAESCEDRM